MSVQFTSIRLCVSAIRDELGNCADALARNPSDTGEINSSLARANRHLSALMNEVDSVEQLVALISGMVPAPPEPPPPTEENQS